MELLSLSTIPSSSLKPPLLLLLSSPPISWRKTRKCCFSCCTSTSSSYKKFAQFAFDETKRRTHLAPSPLQESFSSLMALDGKTELQMISFQAPKIRLLRSFSVEESGGIQVSHSFDPQSKAPEKSSMIPGRTDGLLLREVEVLDFAAFPRPEFDLPIFCASFFTSANINIVVLDLNPLHDIISDAGYKNKYYKNLISLGLKYTELLPWGGKITSESLRFFSPIVIWTKFSSTQDNYNVLYSAFVDYYKAWLELMEQAVEELDASQVSCNQAAQHRYLTWRVEKDPGHQLLKRLVGAACAKDLLRNFLFSGINELGTKTFLDYFPEYKSEDGTVNTKRSIIGKSYESRPWNREGEFMGNSFR